MGDAAPLRLRFDEFELDEGEARLMRAGQPVALPPKAFALLCTLARRGGQLVTKNTLLDDTWGHRHVSESVLKNTVSQLRAALADDAKQPRYIETASRHGYRFIGSGARREAAAPVVTERPPPIGRESALARLQAAWAAAALAQRRVVWIAGEAGVGKTTLIEHFAARCGARVAHGQCVQQFGSGEPFLPVLEALSSLCRRDGALVALLRSVAPTWLLQLPWLCSEGERTTLQQQLSGVHPDRMLREGGELLDRYTHDEPLLLVTEDLHWSDHATVRLLEHVARRRGPARLLWLGSFRPADLIAEGHPLKGLRHELRVHRLCDELALEPFSERELAGYLARRLPAAGGAVSESLVRKLHWHTDGLPLFVVNVVDELLAQGGLDDADARVVQQVPETLGGVVERQLERLSAEQRMLLEAASVHGVEFRPDAVAEALQREPHAVHDHCEVLVRQRQWLRPAAGGFVFRHALVRHAVYQRVGAGARVRLHAAIARALERQRASGAAVAAAELASHYERGHEPAAALRHYADAARSALGRFAPTEAVQLTSQALALLPALPAGVERLELELAIVGQRGVACSMLQTFSAPDAKQAFERALELCDALPQTPQRAWVLNGVGWVLYARGEYGPARELAERIGALATRHDDAALQICACNLMGVTLSQEGDWAGGRTWFERGLALCDTFGRADTQALPLARFVIDPRVSMRGVLGLALLPLGEEAASIARCDEAFAIALESGQPSPMLVALWCLGMLDQRLERPERVLAHAQALERLVVDKGFAAAEGPARWMRGWAEARLGDPRAGHALIVEGLACHRQSGRVAGITHVMGCAADALLRCGDLAGAEAQIDEALQLARQIGEQASIADLWLLRGRAALAAGRRDDAAAAFDASLADARGRQAVLLETVARHARSALER